MSSPTIPETVESQHILTVLAQKAAEGYVAISVMLVARIFTIDIATARDLLTPLIDEINKEPG